VGLGEMSRRGAQAAAGPSKQPGCISLGRREPMKTIPVLLATTFPVLKSTRHVLGHTLTANAEFDNMSANGGQRGFHVQTLSVANREDSPCRSH